MVKKEPDKIEDRGKRGEEVPDFADLYGQENVRRAAEIAVAGGHNLLMVGPPRKRKDDDRKMYGRNSTADELRRKYGAYKALQCHGNAGWKGTIDFQKTFSRGTPYCNESSADWRRDCSKTRRDQSGS